MDVVFLGKEVLLDAYQYDEDDNACDRCHGPNQEGMVGPSLIDSLKKISKDEFTKTVLEGRLDKGMPSFGSNPAVAQNIDQLYAYLKGRSDGAITSARVQEMP